VKLRFLDAKLRLRLKVRVRSYTERSQSVGIGPLITIKCQEPLLAAVLTADIFILRE